MESELSSKRILIDFQAQKHVEGLPFILFLRPSEGQWVHTPKYQLQESYQDQGLQGGFGWNQLLGLAWNRLGYEVAFGLVRVHLHRHHHISC